MPFFKNKKKKEDNKMVLKAIVSGNVIPIEEVEDEVFSSKTLGDGIAIEPEGDIIYAPCDGVISVVAEDSYHAVGMTLNNGVEILIHEGIDTVNLNGKGFQIFVKAGEQVKEGQKLLQFDAKLILENGYKTTCVLALTNTDDIHSINRMTGMKAVQGETIVIELE